MMLDAETATAMATTVATTSADVVAASTSTTMSPLETFFQTQPYLAAFVTCATKACTADALAQSTTAKSTNDNKTSQKQSSIATATVSSEKDFDVHRNLAFFLYGGFWQGMFQQFLFSTVYPTWFASNLDGIPSLWTTLEQVAFDTTIMGPCICMPIVYSIKSLLASSTTENDNDTNFVQRGLSKYWHDITTQGILQTYWSIWIPAQCMTFGVVPSHLRVAFVAAVSFCWVTILSTVSSSSTSTPATHQHSNRRRQPSATHQPQHHPPRPAFVHVTQEAHPRHRYQHP